MSDFYKTRLEVTENMIVAYEDAILALTTSGVMSYSLDTGQTKQTVTKLDITQLNATLDGLYARRHRFHELINGSSGSAILRSCP